MIDVKEELSDRTVEELTKLRDKLITEQERMKNELDDLEEKIGPLRERWKAIKTLLDQQISEDAR